MRSILPDAEVVPSTRAGDAAVGEMPPFLLVIYEVRFGHFMNQKLAHAFLTIRNIRVGCMASFTEAIKLCSHINRCYAVDRAFLGERNVNGDAAGMV